MKMKKIVKKVASTVMAALMVTSTAVATTSVAMAAEQQRGTISIQNVKEGEVYDFYKVLNVSYSGYGEDRVYAYSVNPEFDGFFEEYLDNEDYSTSDGKITFAESKLAYQEILNKTTPQDIAMFATDVQIWAIAHDISATMSVKAAADNINDGRIEIRDVESGYYVMCPKAGSQSVLLSSVFSIGTVTDSVEITNKSSYPTLNLRIVEGENKLLRNDAAFGDTVNYEITSSVPNMNGYKDYVFEVDFSLPYGLTSNDDFSIKIGNKTLERNVDFTIKDHSDYGSSYGTVISFSDFIQYNNQDFVNKDIVITCSAIVTTNAQVGYEKEEWKHANSAQAGLTFSDFAGTSNVEFEDFTPCISTIQCEEVNTHITAIQFTKTNANGNKTLADAVFTIDGWEHTATPVLKDGTVINNSTATVTTDDTGVITLTGIKAGTYTISEIEAPNGYLLLDNPIVITVSFDETTGRYSVDADENVHISALEMLSEDKAIVFNVLNETMSILPNTGSVGTIACIAGGVVVLGGALLALLLVKKNNKNEENNNEVRV